MCVYVHIYAVVVLTLCPLAVWPSQGPSHPQQHHDIGLWVKPLIKWEPLLSRVSSYHEVVPVHDLSYSETETSHCP